MGTKVEFKLPDIGEGVAEGEITSWKVRAGQAVTEDQVMVEVMTDKATVEIGSPVTGTVLELRAKEGQTVPVGSVIIVLESGAAAAKPAAAPSHSAPAHAAPAAAAKPAAHTPAPAVPAAKAAAPASAANTEDVNFALPDIGEGVAEGEVTRWIVKAGDKVREDQPMVEVMTDKATVEIGSPVDGEVVELLVQAGETVPVGSILLVLRARAGAGASVPAAGGHAGAGAHAASGKAFAAAPAAAAVRAGSGNHAPSAGATALLDTGLPARSDGTRRVRAAPATRRYAREAGVDLALLNGSGPHGRILMDDVRGALASGHARPAAPETAQRLPASAAATPAAQPASKPSAKPAAAAPRITSAAAAAPAATSSTAPAPAATAPAAAASVRTHQLEGDERVPLRGLRKRIAAQMRLSKQTAAHFTYVEEIDASELVRLRGAAKARAEAQGVKLSYMPFILKSVAAALRDFPLLNASLDEAAGELVMHRAINLGVAVDTPAGLIVPVLRGVDTKSMLDLGREINELAERARAGKTRPEDIGGGTFTITNAGNIGGLLATPIINVPEVAIMGVHAIRRRPWVVDEEIVIRDIMLLSLSLDHRVVDGAVGARFMNRVKELLESPGLMLFEGL
ncbi:MAG: 2-oxo acid dehydrogenase subunit E2 [Planctomycetota bacterium]